jgi:hypothetical protein
MNGVTHSIFRRICEKAFFWHFAAFFKGIPNIELVDFVSTIPISIIKDYVKL